MWVFPIVVFSTVACDREMPQRAQGKESPSSSDPSRISVIMVEAFANTKSSRARQLSRLDI